MSRKSMILNKKIVDNAREVDPAMTARFDKDGFKELKWNLKHEPLTIVEFLTLADIYKVSFKLTISIKNDKGYLCRTLDQDALCPSIIIDSIVKDRTGLEIDSAGMTITELKQSILPMGGEISFE